MWGQELKEVLARILGGDAGLEPGFLLDPVLQLQ